MTFRQLLHRALGRLDYYRHVEDFDYGHCRYIVVQEGIDYCKCIVLDRTGKIKADILMEEWGYDSFFKQLEKTIYTSEETE